MHTYACRAHAHARTQTNAGRRARPHAHTRRHGNTATRTSERQTHAHSLTRVRTCTSAHAHARAHTHTHTHTHTRAARRAEENTHRVGLGGMSEVYGERSRDRICPSNLLFHDNGDPRVWTLHRMRRVVSCVVTVCCRCPLRVPTTAPWFGAARRGRGERLRGGRGGGGGYHTAAHRSWDVRGASALKGGRPETLRWGAPQRTGWVLCSNQKARGHSRVRIRQRARP